MAIINPESASHWYHPDGSPCHQVPYRDKKRAAAGEMKNTTLKDAREMGLRPSVTNVLGVLAKHMLSAWGRESVLRLAANNPIAANEADDDYIKRIEKLHQVHIDELREIGHRTHAAMEQFATSGIISPEHRKPNPIPVDTAKEWFEKRVDVVQHTEKVVVAGKYAGTLDLIAQLRDNGGRITIADYKTRRSGWTTSKRGEWRCVTYDEDKLQLAAYRGALCEQIGHPFDTPLIDCRSIIIPSDWTGAMLADAYEKEWTMDEMIQSKAAFDALLETWQHLKKYTI